mgnify:CR=1 FL=1
MAENTLEIVEIVNTLEIIAGEESIVTEVVGETIVNILEIAEQGPAGVDGVGGITAVEDDPAPTLGGPLSINGQDVTGTIDNTGLVLDGGLL